jgi:hypothetical protein
VGNGARVTVDSPTCMYMAVPPMATPVEAPGSSSGRRLPLVECRVHHITVIEGLVGQLGRKRLKLVVRKQLRNQS